MPFAQDMEERIRREAERLAHSVRGEIFRMLRSGMNMQEILAALGDFSLPASRLQAFADAIHAELQSAARAQRQLSASYGEAALSHADVDVLLSISDITLPEIKGRIREYLTEEVRRAIAAGYGPDTLRRRLEQHEFGDMQTLAYTQISQFNNNLTFRHAEVSGTVRFLYSGPIAPSTRPFCRAHAGRIFTLAQIAQMDNGQGLPVREACGGYNCRHEWVAVPEGISDKRAGGVSASASAPVRIGKQVFMLDGDSRTKLFSHNRSLWVEYEKGVREGADTGAWLYTAKPLTRAHDGFNEVITNTPSEGVWANIHRAKGKSNFDQHLEKRIKDRHVRSADEYSSAMARVSNDPAAEIHSFLDHDGTRRIVMHSAKNGWDVMIDGFGNIHSAFPHNKDMRFWKKTRLLGTQEQFIGGFK